MIARSDMVRHLALASSPADTLFLPIYKILFFVLLFFEFLLLLTSGFQKYFSTTIHQRLILFSKKY
jgi:hypothetical protein